MQARLIASNGTGIRDPYSAENRLFPIHRWVPWVAGFSAAFVQDVLDCFLPTREAYPPLVLDPFCGVGTTLVESVRYGADGVGFEINPYAALASRVKTSISMLDVDRLRAATSSYRVWMSTFETELRINGESHISSLVSEPPEGFRTRIPFYSDRVM